MSQIRSPLLTVPPKQTNYLNQSSHRGDIEKFLTKYRPEAASAAHEFDIVIINNAENHQGPYNKSDPDYSLINAEGDLDAELVLSLTWPTPFIAYNTGGCDLLSFIVRVCLVANADFSPREIRFSPNGVKLGNEPFVRALLTRPLLDSSHSISNSAD